MKTIRMKSKYALCGFMLGLLLLAAGLFGTQPLAAATLYGVTGDGGDPAETLFILDQTDASSTFVLTLGNGNDGEEIAFNPDDGLLYHASGYFLPFNDPAGKILETIDPNTLAITPVNLSGFEYNEVAGLTYAGSGVFLAGDQSSFIGLSSITSSGVSTSIGSTDAVLTGLAFVGPTLYAVGRPDDLLRTIDPATGATLASVTITLGGFTVSGATGLATNPVDDSLWALLKVGGSFRALATIDTATGVATLIGITDVSGFAGIAFEFDPNQPPEADANGPYLVAVEGEVDFDGSGSSDPDLDTLSYEWTAGGGTLDNNTAESPTYTADSVPGIYDVDLTVNDGTVDSDPDMTTVVVYDPTGGFVTGGGWIASTQDMCDMDFNCDGKANFGFVSKYRRGATVPTGETQFHFKDGDLNFHSDVYQWLVVNQNGQNAQYKGTGTVNGMGNYGFMLWAGDGDNGQMGADDTFRIKIWDQDAGDAVVYDNGFNQAIGGGQIVIHTR